MKPSLNIREKTFPWAALLLLLLTFGLLAPTLGYYFDDWPVIANIRLNGIQTFWEFHGSDRPLAAWTYIVTAPLLGTNKLAWQFFSIVMRWSAVLALWWMLSGLWPERRREMAWMALLFAVYPAFDQQAISVAYSQHWIIYALFFVSMAAMLQAERDRRRYWLWTGLGLAALSLEIFSMEYFVGLELLRPVFLGLATAQPGLNLASQIRNVFKRWLPYLLVLAVYLFWRIWIYPQILGDLNEPGLLYDLFSQPLQALLELGQYVVQDFLNIVIGSWYKTLDPAAYVITDRSVLLSIIIGLAGGALTYYYLRKTDCEGDQASAARSQSEWLRWAFLLGCLGILLGALPVWLTGRETTLGPYGSRFALASMFGASLLTVAVLEWLAAYRSTRLALFCLLIGLAVGFHIRRVDVFRWSWEKQAGFFWQLYWRAPDLKTGAIIAADGEIFPFVGRTHTTYPINILYPETLPYPQVGHAFFELPAQTPDGGDDIVEGIPFDWQYRNFRFSGSTRDIVLIYYAPEEGKCLWVLDPTDGENPELPRLTDNFLEISNLDMIGREAEPQNRLPRDLFGPEPEHDWCYFFQKGDLARQFEDWQEVADLGDQAQEAGHSPNNAQEWIPFIEGYARVGRWQEAFEKTQLVWRVNKAVSGRLCVVWDRILADRPVPEDQQPDYQSLRERLDCQASS